MTKLSADKIKELAVTISSAADVIEADNDYWHGVRKEIVRHLNAAANDLELYADCKSREIIRIEPKDVPGFEGQNK